MTLVASPRRRAILHVIWRDERSAGDIHRAMPDVTFGAVSLQLKQLAAAGLVERRSTAATASTARDGPRSGLWPHGSSSLWDDALWRLKRQAELDAARRGPAPRRRRTPRRKS